ncbi:hypothetical protein Poli38472_000208 [Pythium oligandrum]|uniref:PH domain-containing protein n=1 Tax=Pythium oligandrum TaxID=41045 RepID=A0A8K1FF49_PYTOL|nr:hypothetical protein Poli38472_000208 [Pythium oligandrum]|eukprot:TMW60166.1 hypothetical protein Poli38472_000208 [Pythium oligandrum]
MLRSHKSNQSLLSEASSGSSGSRTSTDPSLDRSIHSRWQSHSGDANEPVVVVQKGYMLIKKGMLKGYEKRFYFLTQRSADLFSFKDELHFDAWFSAGLPLRLIGGNKGNSQFPTFVCTVLRADRSGDNAALDRGIAVLSGTQDKCVSHKFLADTAESCENWIQAFHRIQVSRRENRRTGSDASADSNSTMGPARSVHAPHSSSDSFEQPLLSSRVSRHSDVSDSQSQHSGPSSHNNRSNGGPGSVIGASASAPPPANAGNVLLFVPAAGSAISISDSKLAKAKKEIEELAAQGVKRPMRGGMDDFKTIKWRYGVPEYALADLEYMKGKIRDHEATPLESYVETCCQTFLMEATHKSKYAEWTSVRQEYFYVQVNDGEKIPGHSIMENDLFGMLYLNDYEVDMELRDGEEKKDPRAILAEAFTQGFPMEVLDVFTQPPQCHFSWRHWGRFTGRYRGVRGDGSLIDLRGFGQMHIDSGRIVNLRLFFKQRDLFDQLNKVAKKLAEKQGVVLGATSSTPSRPVRQASGNLGSYSSRRGAPKVPERAPERVPDHLIGDFTQDHPAPRHPERHHSGHRAQHASAA